MAVKLAKVPGAGHLKQEPFNWVWALQECPWKEKAMVGLAHPDIVNLLAKVSNDDGVIMEPCTGGFTGSACVRMLGVSCA